MLLTDQDYPRGYGSCGVVDYIVMHAGGKALWINHWNGRPTVAHFGVLRPTERALLLEGYKQETIPAELLAQAQDFWRRNAPN